MRGIFIVLLALMLGACGGAPSRQSYGRPEINALMQSHMKLGDDYTPIDKEKYPDLYKAVLDSDYTKVADLLGDHPSTQRITSGGVVVIGIKTMRDGKEATSDDLLYYAMKKGDLGLAERLLKDGADPNSLNTQGHSALHVLYAKGYMMPKREKLADMLISRGADLNLKDRNGKTLIHMVLDSDIDDKAGAIRYLVGRGADPDLRSWDEKTALQAVFASDINEKQAVIEYLLDNGADPNMEDSGGSTLLHAVFFSRMEGRQNMVRYLLAHGADPDHRDKQGNTVLHKALSPGLRYRDGVSDEEIISWLEPLTEKGADLDARNRAGMTPLSYARGGTEKYLLKKGAKDYGEGLQATGEVAEMGTVPAENILGMSSLDILGMGKDGCQRLLRDYGVKFAELEGIENVEMPVMLRSEVGGIGYSHTDGSRKFSIMDCRLAAALVGWAPLLKRHGVKEVVHMRAYSPGARVGGGSKVSGHTYALALDASEFVFNDGTSFVVNDDWSDRRNSVDPCEPPEKTDSKAQAELRGIACETGDAGVFSMILTPHYNRAHYDHLHLEVTDEVYGYVR